MSTKPCFTENEEVEMYAKWVKELINKCAARGKSMVEEESIKEYCSLRRQILFLQACCSNIEQGLMKVNNGGTSEAKYMEGDCAMVSNQ